jgi:hypothetical protein
MSTRPPPTDLLAAVSLTFAGAGVLLQCGGNPPLAHALYVLALVLMGTRLVGRYLNNDPWREWEDHQL